MGLMSPRSTSSLGLFPFRCGFWSLYQLRHLFFDHLKVSPALFRISSLVMGYYTALFGSFLFVAGGADHLNVGKPDGSSSLVDGLDVIDMEEVSGSVGDEVVGDAELSAFSVRDLFDEVVLVGGSAVGAEAFLEMDEGVGFGGWGLRVTEDVV